jgi:hypothetical protein
LCLRVALEAARQQLLQVELAVRVELVAAAAEEVQAAPEEAAAVTAEMV